MTSRDWIYAALLVLATALSRSTLVVLGERIRIPERLDAALRYAPACALAAILAPQLFLTAANEPVPWQGSAPLWGAVATAITMLASRSIILALALGLVAFWVLRALGWPV